MTLSSIFFAQIDLELNKLSNEDIAKTANYSGLEMDINGIKTILWTDIYVNKLTRLICFLNLEGPRKILKREHFNKANFIESTSLKRKKHEEKMEYSHIEICLKFENPGNYFIVAWRDFNHGWLQFYVKIKKVNEEKCVFKMFKKISDLLKKVLEGLRHHIIINISKTEANDLEDGQMNVVSLSFTFPLQGITPAEEFQNKYPNETYYTSISPVINDGSYEFYLDSDGITREKI